ncbi:MAG: hypothetical protein Q8S26_15650 [Azonexus sp.]|nr:hypothetical protein [Azonexus sp.]
MPRRRENVRDFPGKRWLNLALRSLHLIGIVLLGAGLFGATEVSIGAKITLFSGLTMFAIDTWANPAQLREVAGFGVLVKLGLVGLMLLQPAWAPVIFWFILILSTLLSHAPGTFRHRRLF